ncbi:MAG: magnesium-translocating P-type ATPase [Cyanobacteria bacterium SZAS-4]|nr:magnesium-translocating P-type ATPase [Cyanobacteria bacterium SZAS-4]
MTKFWTVSAESAMEQLGTCATGLTTLEAHRRLSKGRVKNEQDFQILTLFFNQFKSPLVLLLLFAAALSFYLQDHLDAIVITIIVVISGALGFWQEWGAHDAVKRMLAIVQTKAFVYRDGKLTEITCDKVVVGDLIQLTAGATIPGDCLIVESKDLFVDEAALTGETFPAEKHVGVSDEDAPLSQRDNTLFQGTHVISGIAKAIVARVGSDTEFGKVSKHLKRKAPETDFEHGVRMFGYLLVELTFVLVISIFAINVFLHKPVLESFMFSLALAVGLTPQLLPAIISVNLAGGALRMAKAKVIVKRLASIESFGSMNVLCSDKTGTITEGVVELEAAVDIDAQPSDRVMLWAYLNSSMESGFVNPIDESIRRQPVSGAENYTKVDEVPYDFIRKRLSVSVSNGQGETTLISKGALKNITQICTKFDSKSGEISPETARSKIDDLMRMYSEKGCRVLGLAYKEMSDARNIQVSDESDMTFAGFLIFSDPPKANIQNTIQDLNNLGIKLKIITGDNPLVAEAIAKKVGIESPRLMDAEQLKHLSMAALASQVNAVDVFAGVEPNQKERIIFALKNAGNVVGYVGDGINDAPALHAADVGISVNNAVDVAKEAAQLVMLEHNLDVLVQGVKEGRTTFANTLKYIFMATSANFGNMFSMAGASLFLPFLPLLPKQVLLTNLLTDLPEMAIVTDSVDAELVEAPGKWDMKFIRRFMLVFGTISSVFDYLTFATLIFIFHSAAPQFRTAWFTESVISACSIVLIVRTRKPFFLSQPSKLLALANIGVVVTTLVIPYTPLSEVLQLVPLPPQLLGALAVIVVLYALTAEIGKKIFYAHYKSN